MTLLNMTHDASEVILLSSVFVCCRAVATLVLLGFIAPGAPKNEIMCIMRHIFIFDELLGGTSFTSTMILIAVIASVRHCCWVQFDKLEYVDLCVDITSA